MKSIFPINVMPDGMARILKANYYKMSATNVLDLTDRGGVQGYWSNRI